MEELQTLNKHKKVATNAMSTFLAINTAGVQLVPASIIGILIGAGAKNPTVIIGPTILATGITLITAITVVKILEKLPIFKTENYLEAKKLNSALTPQKFGIPRNNAFFRPGLGSSNFSDSVIDLSKANSPAELRNNIFAKEFYGIEMPGEIAIGREYAEGMPVYDHEINHLLQNTRNTALDDMLRKYFNNSQNLLKDFSQKTNKAYNYFRKSKDLLLSNSGEKISSEKTHMPIFLESVPNLDKVQGGFRGHKVSPKHTSKEKLK
jgi:hypothetical protein